jgi:hypothetical protein
VTPVRSRHASHPTRVCIGRGEGQYVHITSATPAERPLTRIPIAAGTTAHVRF